MSIHTQLIDDHIIHKNLSIANTNIENTKKLNDITVSDTEHIQRIEFILNNFKESISSSNKQLISITWLNEVNTALNIIISNLTNYNSSKNSIYITKNISSYLDIILNNTVKINTIKSKNNLKSFMSTVNNYQKTIDDSLDLLNKSNKKIEFDQTQLSQKIISINENFENAINLEKKRLDNLITKHHNQMSDNNKEFQKQQNEFISAAKILIDKNQEAFDKYQDEVKNIIGIVNTNIFSHKYKEVADKAYKRANFWHIIANIFIVALVAFAIYSSFTILNQNTNWIQFSTKMFVATTLATGLAYAAKQANQHEKTERYTRKIEMEMIAIDPFLESLTEQQRQEVKTEIAHSIFCKSDTTEVTTTDETNYTLNKLPNTGNIILKLIDKIK